MTIHSLTSYLPYFLSLSPEALKSIQEDLLYFLEHKSFSPVLEKHGSLLEWSYLNTSYIAESLSFCMFQIKYNLLDDSSLLFQ